MQKPQIYRHELKYRIHKKEAAVLSGRLKEIMSTDRYAVNGRYKIRSLYFDDYWNTAIHQKLMGISERRKYRIRIYNDSARQINLECKVKSGSFIHKKTAALTKGETESILNNDYTFLLKRDDDLCREFYYQCQSRYMRPKVIVDYDREPLIYEPGDVRVTFDYDIRSAILSHDIFDPDLPALQIMNNEELILEVKYTQFLPKIIRRMLPLESSENLALSKFLMCCEKSDYLSEYKIIN